MPVRTGSLIPNPLVTTGEQTPVRLDAVLRGQTAVLTAGQPTAELVDECRRHRLLLIRMSPSTAEGGPRPGAAGDLGWIEVRVADNAQHPLLRAWTHNPALTVLVRPDRVIAAIDGHTRLLRLPWNIPAGRLRAVAGPSPTPPTRPAGP
jgi:hypothetical protein